MRKAVPLGLVTTALLSASPALASDFLGVGRFYGWGTAALGVLVTVPFVLLARKGLRGAPGGNTMIAIVVAIIFAPAARCRDYEQWQLMPFPGARVATADGSWAELFAVPLISMVLRAPGLCWVLQRAGNLADQIDDAP